ncbi:MAG: PDZ domain-containing protein, partial [Thermoguttaceae bacterium]
MHGQGFRGPNGRLGWGLGAMVLSAWLTAVMLNVALAAVPEEPTPLAPQASSSVPQEPTPAPGPVPSAPPPIVHELAPPGLLPGRAPIGPPPTFLGPPPPGAICRPIPTVAEPVAALGATVTWADEGGGVLVLDVAPFSPAADAGLLRGDRILAINEQLMSTPGILAGYIQRKLPGSRIWIAYYRYGVIQSTNTIL